MDLQALNWVIIEMMTKNITHHLFGIYPKDRK